MKQMALRNALKNHRSNLEYSLPLDAVPQTAARFCRRGGGDPLNQCASTNEREKTGFFITGSLDL